MEEQEIKKKAVEVLTDKPNTVSVSLKNLKWLDRLMVRWNLKSPVQTFLIKPLLVGNRLRIASRSVMIPEDLLKKGIVKALLDPNHAESSIYCTAVGIQNDDHEPTEELLNFVRYQMDDTDMFNVLDTIFDTIPVHDFMNSTSLIKGANVLNAMEKDAANATLPG